MKTNPVVWFEIFKDKFSIGPHGFIEWMDAAKGTFLRIPAGVTHDFENRSEESAGLLNIYIPGGFEKDMPAIVEWFKERAAKG